MSRDNHALNLEEQSRLIANQEEEASDFESRRFSQSSDISNNDLDLKEPTVETKSSWYLFFLTLSIGGLQIVWSVELSNGSPFLLSLGMSKALMAFVWLAGPMTGVLVQPYIGIISDRCRISWGKRKPFMVGGTLGTVVSSLLLAYSKQIVHFVGRWSPDANYEGSYQGITIAFATVMMWILDFSINTVQAAIRAFIVDGAPAHQQEAANAWASRIVGIGNVLGYIFGFLDLPKLFASLGHEQFQVLCAIASIALSSTVLISILTIRERNPQDEPPGKADSESLGFVSFFKQIFESIKYLPAPIRQVCEIQFCQWMGWFPFLFYITTYVGQLYVNPSVHPGMPKEELDQLWAEATRIGTLALLLYAIVSFFSNLLLPFLVVPTYEKPERGSFSEVIQSVAPASPIHGRRRSGSTGELDRQRVLSSRSSQSPLVAGKRTLHQNSSSLDRLLNRLRIPGLTLARAWFLSQVLFSLCMFSTFFITTPLAATIMVSFVGISWSLSLWAPFALVSAEIAKRDEARRLRLRQGLSRNIQNSDPLSNEREDDRAGVLLGLLNVAVSAPQVIATIVSSIVFKMLQKPRDVPGDTSVAVSLRLGGIAALVAAYLTWRMQKRESSSGNLP